MRRVEGVADRDVDVLVLMVLGRVAADDDVAALHEDVQPDVVDAPVLLVAMRRLDHDLAGRHAVEAALEPLDALLHLGLDRRRGLHVPETDRGLHLHGLFLLPMGHQPDRPSANEPRRGRPGSAWRGR